MNSATDEDELYGPKSSTCAGMRPFSAPLPISSTGRNIVRSTSSAFVRTAYVPWIRADELDNTMRSISPTTRRQNERIETILARLGSMDHGGAFDGKEGKMEGCVLHFLEVDLSNRLFF